MDDGKKVWVPHPTEGFRLGRIIDIGVDGIVVEPFNAPGQVREPRNYHLFIAQGCC